MSSLGPLAPPPQRLRRQPQRDPAEGYSTEARSRRVPSKQPLSGSEESAASHSSSSKRRKLDAAAPPAPASSSSSSSSALVSQDDHHEEPHSDSVPQVVPSCVLDPASFTTAGRPPQSVQVLQMIEGSAIGAAIQASLQRPNASGPALPALMNAASPLGSLLRSSWFAPLPSAPALAAAAPSAPAQLNLTAAASAPSYTPVKRQRKSSLFGRYHSANAGKLIKAAYEDIVRQGQGSQKNTPDVRSKLMKQVNSEVSSAWNQLSEEAKNAFAADSSAPVATSKPKSHRRTTVLKKAMDIFNNLIATVHQDFPVTGFGVLIFPTPSKASPCELVTMGGAHDDPELSKLFDRFKRDLQAHLVRVAARPSAPKAHAPHEPSINSAPKASSVVVPHAVINVASAPAQDVVVPPPAAAAATADSSSSNGATSSSHSSPASLSIPPAPPGLFPSVDASSNEQLASGSSSAASQRPCSVSQRPCPEPSPSSPRQLTQSISLPSTAAQEAVKTRPEHTNSRLPLHQNIQDASDRQQPPPPTTTTSTTNNNQLPHSVLSSAASLPAMPSDSAMSTTSSPPCGVVSFAVNQSAAAAAAASSSTTPSLRSVSEPHHHHSGAIVGLKIDAATIASPPRVQHQFKIPKRFQEVRALASQVIHELYYATTGQKVYRYPSQYCLIGPTWKFTKVDGLKKHHYLEILHKAQHGLLQFIPTATNPVDDILTRLQQAVVGFQNELTEVGHPDAASVLESATAEMVAMLSTAVNRSTPMPVGVQAQRPVPVVLGSTSPAITSDQIQVSGAEPTGVPPPTAAPPAAHPAPAPRPSAKELWKVLDRDTSPWIPELVLCMREKNILASSVAWLLDTHMDAAQKLLHLNFPQLPLAQTPLKQNTVSGYEYVPDEGVQILIAGSNHWIATTSIGFAKYGIRVFDSLKSKGRIAQVEPWLRQLYRIEDGRMKPSDARFQQQVGSNDCGLFAIAAIVSLALGEDPSSRRYDQDRMRPHLLSCFEQRRFTSFPAPPPGSTVIYK